jgi:hypothetical protein
MQVVYIVWRETQQKRRRPAAQAIMTTPENTADEIRKPENQLEIVRRLSAYAKRLRGED